MKSMRLPAKGRAYGTNRVLENLLILKGDTTATSKYKVKLELEDYIVTAQYHEIGSAIGDYREWEVDVRPSQGKLTMRVSLSEGSVLFTKEYASSKITAYIKSQSNSRSGINNSMMQNMTETLAQCIKENISDIVSDINMLVSP